jgi:hypothetical protein
MGTKNQIKIDSFEIRPLRTNDIPEVLRLAVKAQGSFGITSTVSPSMFLKEMAVGVQNNSKTTMVFVAPNLAIFCVFVFRHLTSVSAELSYVFSDPRVIQTEKLKKSAYDVFANCGYREVYVNVFKKRKRLNSFLKILKTYGFSEVMEDNDSFLKLKFKKLDNP